jgi:hypothetical protein
METATMSKLVPTPRSGRPARSLLLLFAAGLCSAPAVAQSDKQVWGNASLTVKLGDRWRISQELTTRFSDNRNGLYEVESNTLLGYRINKVVTVWAGYTHDPQYAAGDFTMMEHRAREQVTFDNFARIGPGKLTGRIRLEQRWRKGIDGIGWRVRPYIKFSVPLKSKAALNLSSEAFFNLNKTAFQRADGLDRMRNLVTISTPLSKVLTGEAGYMNQHGFVRGGEDTSDNIAYFALSLSL